MSKNAPKLNYQPRLAPNTLHPPLIDTSNLVRDDLLSYRSIIEAITALVSNNQETMKKIVQSNRQEFAAIRKCHDEKLQKICDTIDEIQPKRGSKPFAMESRFTHIDLNVPKLSLSGNRRRLISIWLGKLVPKILSFCFNAFEKGEMDENQTKVHCSEMMILAIVRLIKENDLSEEEVKFVDEQCLKRILEYNAAKYPQSSEVEKNKDIEGIITERDDIGDPSNDLVAKSGVEFTLKESGNYNSEIMRFFNYLIGLIEDKKYEGRSLNKALEQIEFLSDNGRFDKDERGRKRKLIDEDKTTGQMIQLAKIIEDQNQQTQERAETIREVIEDKKSLFKQFQQDIQTLFSIVEDEEKVTLLSVKPTEKRIKQKQKTKKLEKKEKQKIQDRNVKLLDEQRQKLKYKEEVKTYTTSAVGSKFSPNTLLFSPAEIENGDLSLSNPTLFRVATKWVQELENYFKEISILGKEYRYKMRQGQGYLMEKEFRMLNLLLQYFKKAEGGPDECLKEIMRNAKSLKRIFAREECQDELLEYTQEQAIVGKFALTLHRNSETYLIRYLNCLIHALLSAAEVKRRWKVNGCESYKEIRTKEVNEINRKYERQTQEGKETAQFSTTPCLVTFSIGDLLRCKLSSRDKEIKAIYKLLDLVSKRNPEIINLVRVKNRLSTGNRDILINLTYRRTLLVEVQLATKTNKSHFIERSNAFNHFIYELKRAKFGPVTELCSIWAAKDPRADFYKSHIAERTQLKVDRREEENTNEKRKQKKKEENNLSRSDQQLKAFVKNEENEVQLIKESKMPVKMTEQRNKCLHPQEQRNAISLPYVCCQCSRYFFNMFYKSIYCKGCQRNLCFNCQDDTLQQKEKVVNEYLKHETSLKVFDTKKMSLQQAYENLPKHCYLLKIKSSNRQPREAYKIVKDNKIYYLTKKLEKGKVKYEEAEKINNKEQLVEFLTCNIIVERNLSQRQDIIGREIEQLYFLPNQLTILTKKEKQSITIVNGGLTNQSLLRLLQNTDRKWHSLRQLNLSENRLTSTNEIWKMEPRSLEILILSYNQEIPMLINEDLFNLSLLSNLRRLELKQCKKLKKLPNNIDKLQHLTYLNLSQCPSLLSIVTPLGRLQSLKDQNLESLTHYFSDLQTIQNLNLVNCDKISSLPPSFGELKSLKILYIRNCPSLISLPHKFGDLASVEKIDLIGCNKINSLPASLGKLKSLSYLSLSKCFQIKQLPEDFGNLQSLRDLNFYQCRNLDSLTQSFGKLKMLMNLNFQYCFSMNSLPENFGNLQSLNYLNFSTCAKLKSMSASFGRLRLLRTLNIKNCESIEYLPDNFGSLQSLENLELSFCQKLYSLPASFGELKSLKMLEIQNCKSLNSLSENFGNLPTLQKLDLYFCYSLHTLPDSFGKLRALKNLEIFSCFYLKSLPENFGDLQSLEMLKISHCQKLKILPVSFGKLNSVKKLCLSSCQSLQSLPNSLYELNSLENLSLSKCYSLKLLPLPISRLKQIKIQHDFDICVLAETLKMDLKCIKCPNGCSYPLYNVDVQQNVLCQSCYGKHIQKEQKTQTINDYTTIIFSESSTYLVLRNNQLISSYPPASILKTINYACSGCKIEGKVGSICNLCIGCPYFETDHVCVLCQQCMKKVIKSDAEISQHLQSLNPKHQPGHNWAKIKIPGKDSE